MTLTTNRILSRDQEGRQYYHVRPMTILGKPNFYGADSAYVTAQDDQGTVVHGWVDRHDVKETSS